MASLNSNYTLIGTGGAFIDSMDPTTNIEIAWNPNLYESERNFRRIEDENDGRTFAVSDINQIGEFTKYGTYNQNVVTIPKFDLSNITVLPEDSEYNSDGLNFILSIKDGETSIPKLYTTKKYYDSLVSNYTNKTPFKVNLDTHERSIVVIDIEPLAKKIAELREAELSINLNREGTDGKIEISRNVFEYANYTKDANNTLTANPTYEISDLVKYISWVVSKPTGDYNKQLLYAGVIGDWTGEIEETPDEDEPSNVVTTNTPPIIYPPVGRVGISDEERVFVSGILYVWNLTLNKWQTESERDDWDLDNNVNTGSGNPVVDAAALEIISKLEAAETTARNFYNEKKSELDSLPRLSIKRPALLYVVFAANLALETAKAALKAAKKLYGLV